MISVIIINSNEPNVVQLTFENLYSELKDIYGSELLIKDKWFDLEGIKNRYVCFVEADCLVSPGYFKAQLEGFMEKGYSRNIGIMSSATSVEYWANKIYGYHQEEASPNVLPNRSPKSSSPFAVQIAYIPGSVIRVTMLKACIEKAKIKGVENDLVYLSTLLSTAFWEKSAKSSGKSHRICLNPKASYLTTETYVNDIGGQGVPLSLEVEKLFAREST